MSEDVKLFEAPDLAALQRNWPRIALRAAVLVLVPVLIAALAGALDLYGIVAALPLPLDFLAAGPFAYEAKVIAAIAATFLGLAYLLPKRTSQIVIAVCVGGILWTGHVFITLQWARLLAPGFSFRREAMPEPAAWVYGTLLLFVGVLHLVVEDLLETRAQQAARRLPGAETDAALRASAGTLATMLGAGAAIAAVLAAAYLGLRALLAEARLPFRLDPVLVLLGMGVALAVLVALATRRRAPVDTAPEGAEAPRGPG